MSDTKDPKPSPSSPRTASSIGKSPGSGKSTGGNLADRPIARATTGGAEDGPFIASLLMMFQRMEQKLRLAKVMLFSDPKMIQVYGVVKDEWKTENAHTVRLLQFWTTQSGPPCPGYENLCGHGVEVTVPLQDIKGFAWARPLEEARFLDGLGRYERTN